MLAPDLNTAIPFFQPIIRTADLGVFAYEVLARENRDGKVRSLGPYFEDPKVPDRDKLTLDLHVRKLALEAYAASGSSAKLFINLKPSWIYEHGEHDSGILSTLALLERHKIDPQRIVIEVTEEEIIGDSDAFGKLLAEYRKAGCMLAVDDFGKGESSVERIAHITQDIIKIDSSIVQKTDTHRSFYEICSAMSSFGAISGFDLLFEGVETAFQLERCVKTGWCYLQGYIFSQAKPGFETEYANRDLLADILYIEHARTLWNIKCRNEVAANMEREVERLLPLVPLEEEALMAPGALSGLAKALPYYCLRCFVCDRDGRRLSHVYQLVGHEAVTVLPGSRATGIPHTLFILGLDAVSAGRAGSLSDLYKNVATKESVMTYMHRLRRDRLLCVDVMSTVLF
jgi:EAL domain-containing protein (putative c-di-GMP-specific phosphodiesterase class I)